MADIKHHLTDQLLMGYAAGTLPEAFSLVVATHVSLCDECRSRLGEFEAVGGEVMMSAGSVSMSNDAFAATMALIANTPEAPQKRYAKGIFPAPLQDYVGGDKDDVRWRPVGGGVRQMILASDGGATVRLLHIPGGVAVPDHGHRGLELTLVLQGAFKDEADRFGVGDIEVANEELNHTPIAEEGEACICLAATDAPLKFNSFLPRIAQRFVKI
ncbi:MULTISPECIES: ChrR family anti-sigma-E factor [unclassified Marivivens]|jgi:putative transcriptional regulator|uniref:ChrR family anti-sigma-E factor n=1 Tax=unclassified Marivivens TaxID=2622455 RepID=UPI000802370D|nr:MULTISPECIES: ChrR family anti-sigma-E factor [unclassified Marivivens]MCL7404671.1 ChrR family anti-sigma-E factor [Marivivens geojensis]OBR35517.1 transcriptional regulator [Donghicola sp. JL3646]APO85583.1 transcriptional regulator [Marivivens sp. JLT3646]NBQ49803.1 transcriptional regulator [Marivivens sp.]NBT50793.1 transcriptional regulator [Marivivens sp.]